MVVVDELTRDIQDYVFLQMPSLSEETEAGVNAKLDLWRETLESKGFSVYRSKTEYMESKISSRRHRHRYISLDGVKMKYLRVGNLNIWICLFR